VSSVNDDWVGFSGRRLDTYKSFFRIIPNSRNLRAGMPAHIQPLSKNGFGKVAWPDYGSENPRGFETIVVHRAFSNCRKIELANALKGNVKDALKIAKGISFDWGKFDALKSEIVYPDWIDWVIARHWFQRAAELGSSEAIELLNHPIWQKIRWR
jgi:hypothetical protein